MSHIKPILAALLALLLALSLSAAALAAEGSAEPAETAEAGETAEPLGAEAPAEEDIEEAAEEPRVPEEAPAAAAEPALSAPVTDGGAKSVSGTVYTSSLWQNDSLVLTGETTLIVDEIMTLTGIAGEYPLHISIREGSELDIISSTGDGIRASSLEVRGPGTLLLNCAGDGINVTRDIELAAERVIVVGAGENGILSADGDITVSCAGLCRVGNAGENGLYAKTGDIYLTTDGEYNADYMAIRADAGSVIMDGDITAQSGRSALYLPNGRLISRGSLQATSTTESLDSSFQSSCYVICADGASFGSDSGEGSLEINGGCGGILAKSYIAVRCSAFVCSQYDSAFLCSTGTVTFYSGGTTAVRYGPDDSMTVATIRADNVYVYPAASLSVLGRVYGILADKNFSSYGSVFLTAYSDNTGYYRVGLYSDEVLLAGPFAAEGWTRAVRSEKSITLGENCVITRPAGGRFGAYAGSYTALDAGGEPVGDLTIEKPQTIAAVTVEYLPHPEGGRSALDEMYLPAALKKPADGSYTVTGIDWYEYADGEFTRLTGKQEFEIGHYYTAMIAVQAGDGWRFTGDTAVKVRNEPYGFRSKVTDDGRTLQLQCDYNVVTDNIAVITFYGNGGLVNGLYPTVVSDFRDYESYSKFLTGPPTRAGYVFTGWYTLPEGGKAVDVSGTVGTNLDRTLYAHWVREETGVVFTGCALPVPGEPLDTTRPTCTLGNVTGLLWRVGTDEVTGIAQPNTTYKAAFLVSGDHTDSGETAIWYGIEANRIVYLDGRGTLFEFLYTTPDRATDIQFTGFDIPAAGGSFDTTGHSTLGVIEAIKYGARREDQPSLFTAVDTASATALPGQIYQILIGVRTPDDKALVSYTTASWNGMVCDGCYYEDRLNWFEFFFEIPAPEDTAIHIAFVSVSDIDEPVVGQGCDPTFSYPTDEGYKFGNYYWFDRENPSEVMTASMIFQAGHEYGVHFEFTVKEGYVFDEDTAAAFNAGDVDYVSVSSDGSRITFEYWFPPLEPTAPAGSPAISLASDGKTARAENFDGLYARVALILDNNGVSGLYITQATINPGGEIIIPAFMMPGLTVKGVSVALVQTLADIQNTTPDVAASDFLMY